VRSSKGGTGRNGAEMTTTKLPSSEYNIILSNVTITILFAYLRESTSVNNVDWYPIVSKVSVTLTVRDVVLFVRITMLVPFVCAL